MSFWKNNHLTTVSHDSGPYPGGNNNNNNNTRNPPSYGQQQQQQQQQQHHYQTTHPSQATTATSNGNTTIETNGPRAKCDQVVFEAIAKAAEIVVGSRCWIDPTNMAIQQQQQQQQPQLFYNNGNGTSNVASSSRFNLFVVEVQGVR
jgi:hypothetical protein